MGSPAFQATCAQDRNREVVVILPVDSVAGKPATPSATGATNAPENLRPGNSRPLEAVVNGADVD